MAEQDQDLAQPEFDAQPTVQPEEVSPDVFEAMYAETAGRFPLSTEAENIEEGDTMEDVDDMPPAADLIQQRLDYMQQTIAAQQQQLASLGHQNHNQSQPLSVSEQIRQDDPDLTDAQVKWLVDKVGKIAGPMVGGLQQQVNQLLGRAQQQDQQNNVADFDAHVNRLMDKHHVDDPWMRKVMRHAVVNEGLAAYGNQFSKELATRQFLALNNERVEKAHGNQEAYVNGKQRNARETPPVSGPVSTQTGVQSIRTAVRDPNNKRMDFRGDTMTEMVSKYLEAAEKGVDNALGGSRG